MGLFVSCVGICGVLNFPRAPGIYQGPVGNVWGSFPEKPNPSALKVTDNVGPYAADAARPAAAAPAAAPAAAHAAAPAAAIAQTIPCTGFPIKNDWESHVRLK